MRGGRLPFLLVLAAGCGSDPQHPQDHVDAPRPDDSLPWKVLGEGGEVRVEHVRFAGGNAATRVTAFLYKAPGSTLPFPFPDFDGCTDTSRKLHWPTAEIPVAERVYLDPGKVTISGGPQVLDVPRHAADGKDGSGRTHPGGAWFFHFGGDAATDGPTYLPPKTALDVTFAGTAALPAQVFEDVLYMPADFDLLTPGTAPLAIPAGTPQTFTWTTPSSSPPLGTELLSLVVFTGPSGPAVLCTELNDGSLTVPASMIDVARARYPGGGTLERQTYVHQVRDLVDASGPTRRRIDFIAIWTHATTFTVP